MISSAMGRSGRGCSSAVNGIRRGTARVPAQKIKLSSTPKHFFVEYTPSCDGGEQERDAAIELVRRVYPDAIIDTALQGSEPDAVRFSVGTRDTHTEVITVNQKDLYAKYGHPAKEIIEKTLRGLM